MSIRKLQCGVLADVFLLESASYGNPGQRYYDDQTHYLTYHPSSLVVVLSQLPDTGLLGDDPKHEDDQDKDEYEIPVVEENLP